MSYIMTGGGGGGGGGGCCPTDITTSTTFYVSNYSGTLVGGSGYTASARADGGYLNVSLTGGSGTGMLADVLITGGVVTGVRPQASGSGYVVSDVLSATAASIGGTGSGFTFTLTAIGSNSNNGLTALTPWQTIQYAVDTVLSDYTVPFSAKPGGAPIVTIQVADGTYFDAGGNALQLFTTTFLNRWIHLTGNTSLPQNVLLTSTDDVGVIFVEGYHWTLSGLYIDASASTQAFVTLVTAGGLDFPGGVLLEDAIWLGQAGNDPSPSNQGYHTWALDGSFIEINNSVALTVVGTAYAFAFLKCEDFPPAHFGFNHGALDLAIDPKWPGGTLHLNRGPCTVTWSPDGGVTGTSSGPQISSIPGTLVYIENDDPTTIPGDHTLNFIRGDVVDNNGPWYGWETAYTASDNSGTVVIGPPTSVTTWKLTLPTTAGTAGYLLKTDGSGNTSWVAASSASAGGSNLDVQFNNSGTLDGDDGLKYLSTGVVSIGKASTQTGKIEFIGTTSGTVSLSTQDAAGTWTMKLPTTAGTANWFLQTDGSGNTTWAAASGGSVSITAGPGLLATPSPITGTGVIGYGNPQFNPIGVGAHTVLSGTNQIATGDGTTNFSNVHSVAGHAGGKWYAEFTVGNVGVAPNNSACGVASLALPTNKYVGQDANSWGFFSGSGGGLYHNNVNSPIVTGTPNNGDVIGIAWDADTGMLFFALNNTWLNTGDPVAETNACYTNVFGSLFLYCNTHDTGQWELLSPIYTPPVGYSPWGYEGTSITFPGSTGDVLYNTGFGAVGASSNLLINTSTGNGQVKAGGALEYDTGIALQAETSAGNWFLAGAGGLGSGASNVIGIGPSALHNIGSGDNGHIAIGIQALFSSGGAQGCTAIGTRALFSAATGADNCVALGNDALHSNIDGAFNLGIGFQNLFTLDHGLGNVVVGVQSFDSLVGSGSNLNVGIGVQCGRGLASGADAYNTFIGTRSGNGITTGTGNTILGSPGASTIGSGTVNNCLFITTVNGSSGVLHIDANFTTSGRLTISDPLQLTEAANLVHTSVSLTDHSAANTATLTNGPTAGNPTKWFAIDDNGTTRYLPAW